MAKLKRSQNDIYNIVRRAIKHAIPRAAEHINENVDRATSLAATRPACATEEAEVTEMIANGKGCPRQPPKSVDLSSEEEAASYIEESLDNDACVDEEEAALYIEE